MASLDDTHEALMAFHRALTEFNETLAASVREVKDRHADIEGLWTDSVAERYRAVFGPFAETIDLYIASTAPRFEDFLKAKVNELDHYLNGY